MVKRFSENVELFQAFVWTCPECGIDQFERSIHVELSAEEMQELREDHGVEAWAPGQFVTAPHEVKCKHCEALFPTNMGVESIE
jgi:hypothetical protein